VRRRDEPEAVPEQPSRQGRDGQAEVGPRVQRLPRLHRRLHEPSARSDRRVHRRGQHRKSGRSSRQVKMQFRLIF
jgi:hypothetical protein